MTALSHPRPFQSMFGVTMKRREIDVFNELQIFEDFLLNNTCIIQENGFCFSWDTLYKCSISLHSNCLTIKWLSSVCSQEIGWVITELKTSCSFTTIHYKNFWVHAKSLLADVCSEMDWQLLRQAKILMPIHFGEGVRAPVENKNNTSRWQMSYPDLACKGSMLNHVVPYIGNRVDIIKGLLSIEIWEGNTAFATDCSEKSEPPHPYSWSAFSIDTASAGLQSLRSPKIEFGWVWRHNLVHMCRQSALGLPLLL